MADLMVRVTAPNYETWLQAFGSVTGALREHGISDWTIYRDSWNSHIMMVHFVADDLDQALAFFQSDAFRQADAASGATARDFYIASKQ